MTPPEYLIPRTEVPVTMGRRVLSVEAAVEARTDAPPDERESDMMRVKMSLKSEAVMMLLKVLNELFS
jgi:hypothetical protein